MLFKNGKDYTYETLCKDHSNLEKVHGIINNLKSDL
jgi:hypothetical protein